MRLWGSFALRVHRPHGAGDWPARGGQAAATSPFINSARRPRLVKGAKIGIDPDPVIQNGTLTVTVSVPGGDPSDWHMRIVAARGSPVMLAPRGLGAYGSPREGESGAYDCRIQITGFEPGEYLVDLSHNGAFDSPGMASKKFTVEPQEIMAVSASKSGPDWGSSRRNYGDNLP